jgi:hypothetical protein
MRASAAVGWWIMASCVAARTAFSRDNEPPPPRSSYILSYLLSPAVRTLLPSGLGPRCRRRSLVAMASSAAACDAAAEALAANDPEEALAAAEAAVVLQPESSRAWSLRAQALNELQLFADVLAAVPYMRSLGDADNWQQEAERATASLQSLFALLPAAMAGTASSDPDERLAAWTELAEADPTSLQARSSLYTSWLQEAARCGQPSEPGLCAT